MMWHARNVLGSRVISDYLSSESSEGEFVEEEKPWPPPGRTSRPPKRTPHIPRPHSHLFRTSDGRRARGNKHGRRWENCMHSVAHDECFIEWLLVKKELLTLFLTFPHLQVLIAYSIQRGKAKPQAFSLCLCKLKANWRWERLHGE